MGVTVVSEKKPGITARAGETLKAKVGTTLKGQKASTNTTTTALPKPGPKPKPASVGVKPTSSERKASTVLSKKQSTTVRTGEISKPKAGVPSRSQKALTSTTTTRLIEPGPKLKPASVGVKPTSSERKVSAVSSDKQSTTVRTGRTLKAKAGTTQKSQKATPSRTTTVLPQAGPKLKPASVGVKPASSERKVSAAASETQSTIGRTGGISKPRAEVPSRSQKAAISTTTTVLPKPGPSQSAPMRPTPESTQHSDDKPASSDTDEQN